MPSKGAITILVHSAERDFDRRRIHALWDGIDCQGRRVETHNRSGIHAVAVYLCANYQLDGAPPCLRPDVVYNAEGASIVDSKSGQGLIGLDLARLGHRLNNSQDTWIAGSAARHDAQTIQSGLANLPEVVNPAMPGDETWAVGVGIDIKNVCDGALWYVVFCIMKTNLQVFIQRLEGIEMPNPFLNDL